MNIVIQMIMMIPIIILTSKLLYQSYKNNSITNYKNNTFNSSFYYDEYRYYNFYNI
jgi:hypothetical protein